MKPHIKKVNGYWWCESFFGDTPISAYEAWCFSESLKPTYNPTWSGQWKGA